MDKSNEYAYIGIKIVFTIISVLLMFPLMIHGGINYYRTLFIFLIGKIIDLAFGITRESNYRLRVWDMINQILGTAACAFSFCAMIPDFFALFKKYAIWVNMLLMLFVISCVLKDIFKFILLTIKINTISIESDRSIKRRVI